MNLLNRLAKQRTMMASCGLLPTGVSMSMDLLMDKEVGRILTFTGPCEQQIFGLPLTIIADKNDVIAWSFE